MKPREYTTDANYTYTCLTHIHIDQSKQGPRDYVWAGNYDFAWSTCPRRSTIDSALIILHRSLSSRRRVVLHPSSFWILLDFLCASRISLFLLSFYSHDDYIACLYTYALYLFNLSLYLSISNFFYRFDDLSCMQRWSLLRMMCIIYHDDNS